MAIKVTGTVDINASAAVKSVDDLNNSVDKLNKNLDKTSETDLGLDTSTKAVDDLSKSIQGLGNSTKSLKDIKSEIKTLKDSLVGLDTGSEEFKSTTAKIAGLKDQLDDINDASKETGSNLERAGTQASAAFSKLASGDLQGGSEAIGRLAGSVKNISFKEIKSGAADFGKAMGSLGKALLTNPIFLIGAAIALIILNFEKLTKAIPGFGKAVDAVKESWDNVAFAIGVGVNPELIKANKLSEEKVALAEKELQGIEDSSAQLQLQGLSEEEITQLKRDKLVLIAEEKKKQVEIAQQQEADLIKSKKNIRGYVETFTNILGAVLIIPIKVIQKIGEGLAALGAISEETNKTLQEFDLAKPTADFFVGTDADIEAGVKGNTETLVGELDKAKTAIAKIDLDARKKREAAAKAANDKALADEKKYQEDRIKLLQDLQKQLQDVQNQNDLIGLDEFEQRRAIQQQAEIEQEESINKQLEVLRKSGKSEDEIRNVALQLKEAYAISNAEINKQITADEIKFNQDAEKVLEDANAKVVEAITNIRKAQAEASGDQETLKLIDKEAIEKEFEDLKATTEFSAEDLVLVEEEKQRRIDEVDKKYKDAKFAREKEDQLKRVELASQYLDVVSGFNDVLNQIDENRIKAAEGNEAKIEKIRKQQFIRNKALQLAETGMQIAKNIVTAQANVATAPVLVPLAIASGAAQIAKILATKYQGASGGGDAPSIGASTPGSAPIQTNLNPDLIGPAGGANAKPDNRVYVLESDITTTQSRVKTAESRSTIG